MLIGYAGEEGCSGQLSSGLVGREQKAVHKAGVARTPIPFRMILACRRQRRMSVIAMGLTVELPAAARLAEMVSH